MVCVGVGVNMASMVGGVVFICVRTRCVHTVVVLWWRHARGGAPASRFLSPRARAGARMDAGAARRRANRARLFRPITFAEDCFLGLVLEHDVVEDF